MIFARSKPDLLRASAVLAAFLLSSAAFMLPAQQKLRWSVDAGAVMENREGDDYYSPDQTLAFTRLSPEVGMSFLGGKHNIMAGASWYQPIGNGWKDYKLSPTVYYRYTSPSLKLSFLKTPETWARTSTSSAPSVCPNVSTQRIAVVGITVMVETSTGGRSTGPFLSPQPASNAQAAIVTTKIDFKDILLNYHQ